MALLVTLETCVISLALNLGNTRDNTCGEASNDLSTSRGASRMEALLVALKTQASIVTVKVAVLR